LKTEAANIELELLNSWEKLEEWHAKLRLLQDEERIWVYNLMNGILNTKTVNFPDLPPHMILRRHLYNLAYDGWKLSSKIRYIQQMFPKLADSIFEKM
jgi:hypothetical protein